MTSPARRRRERQARRRRAHQEAAAEREAERARFWSDQRRRHGDGQILDSGTVLPPMKDVSGAPVNFKSPLERMVETYEAEVFKIACIGGFRLRGMIPHTPTVEDDPGSPWGYRIR